jgi:hypothetical protein
VAKTTIDLSVADGPNEAMKKSSLDQEIRRRIDALLHDISSLVKSSALEAVRSVLGDVSGASPAAASAAAAKPARPARASGKRGKRTSEEVNATAASILAHVKSNAGQRLEEIAKGMGIATKEMKLPIQKLLAERALRTEGRKRGTKYFAGGKRAGRKGRARKA